MNRQIALAYAIAGLSTAVATVVVIGTTVGFDAPTTVAAPSGDLLAQADDAPAQVASAPAAPAPVTAPASAPARVAPPVVEEVVYVDETGAPLVGPQTVRSHDDEDDDDEHHEAANDDEDDDGHHGRRRGHRREHDDD